MHHFSSGLKHSRTTKRLNVHLLCIVMGRTVPAIVTLTKKVQYLYHSTSLSNVPAIQNNIKLDTSLNELNWNTYKKVCILCVRKPQ